MLAFGVAGCQGYEIPQFNTPRFDSTIFVPNPTQFVRKEATLTSVTPADLVDGAGNCAGAPVASDGGGGAVASPPRSIALRMTECDVVRAAGPPAAVEIGANERGDRSVTLTYPAADKPIYRFTAGRLTSIERGAEPPPEPAKKKPAPKRKNSRPTT